MTAREHLHELVERLLESETGAASRYLEFLLSQQEAPVDPEMLRRIDAARAAAGPGVSHEEIVREFGA